VKLAPPSDGKISIHIWSLPRERAVGFGAGAVFANIWDRPKRVNDVQEIADHGLVSRGSRRVLPGRACAQFRGTKLSMSIVLGAFNLNGIQFLVFNTHEIVFPDGVAFDLILGIDDVLLKKVSPPARWLVVG
jgi:hypothetical protein